LAGRGVLPCHQLALRVQAGAETADAHRAVEVMLQIFAAARTRFAPACPSVALATTAAWAMMSISRRRPKPLPGVGMCNCTLVTSIPSCFAAALQAKSGTCVRRPRLRHAVFEPHSASHGFHGGMCQITRVVLSFHGTRCFLQSVSGIASWKIGKACVAVQGLAQIGYRCCYATISAAAALSHFTSTCVSAFIAW
jgi:hypothetical protein